MMISVLDQLLGRPARVQLDRGIADESHRDDLRGRVRPRCDPLGHARVHQHLSNVQQLDVLDLPDNDARDFYRRAHLEVARLLELDLPVVLQVAADRAPLQPGRAHDEQHDRENHEGPDGHFLLVGRIHVRLRRRKWRRGSRAPGTPAPSGPSTSGIRPACPAARSSRP